MHAARVVSKLPRRLLSAQAVRKTEVTGTPDHVRFDPRVQVTNLPSGMVITSLQNYSPAPKIGVFFRAGCRYETPDILGVTHLLRLAAGLTTKGASALRICRGIEEVGGKMSVTASRENMVYSVDCLRDDTDTVLEYLINATTAPEFRPWEVSDLTPRVKMDKELAAQSPRVCVIEALHGAAYKNFLCNSLYCPDHMVGNIKSEQMHHYVQNNFTAARMALVGLGVDHDVLRRYGEQFHNIPSGFGTTGAVSRYRGGEVRQQSSSSLVHCAVVSQSARAGTREALSFNVLQHILGTGPHIKRGSNTTSKLVQGISEATSGPFDATAYHESYSDSGLFGVYTICQHAVAGDVIKAALAQVKGIADGAVTAAELARAQKQLKAQYLMSLETSEGLMDAMGTQALSGGVYISPDTVADSIDSISLTDIANAAKTFVVGEKSMASSGNLVKTPFIDEI